MVRLFFILISPSTPSINLVRALISFYPFFLQDLKPGATDLPTLQRCDDIVHVALKVYFERLFGQRSEIAAQIE